MKHLLKIGEYNTIILFDDTFNPLQKIIDSFPEKIEKENNENYKNILIKNKSPFRIGIIRINIFYFKNVLTKKNNLNFNKEKFTILIKEFCKEHKQSMILLPMSSILNNFKKEIYEVLETTVYDTKVTILN